MIAKTMFGLEEVLAQELRNLGAQDIKKMNRAVSFKGDIGFLYKANLNLRTALRILKPIKYFQAHNNKELYKKLYEVEWSKIFKLNNTFSTSATTKSDTFKHSKFTSLLLKDAIADSFREKYKKRPNVDPEEADIHINLHISKNTCTLSLDSSGKSLHKRGYKIKSLTAPINEVLASGLILISNWDKKKDFHDPMCGSGTILIEAAMIAQNIPANIFRKKFSFQKWKDFDSNLWEKIKETSLDKEIDFKGKITGSDISNRAIDICKKNINNALMKNKIEVFQADFFSTKVNENTFVLFNPPYGERLKLNQLNFYEDIGNTLKHSYEECDVWLISSDISEMKFIGLKPNKKIKLVNGKLECSFRKFQIYKGSKKLNKN
ncbi:MAG: class I SAM-dependent RNA methyltransferase [Bacteroidota bacterium]|nr:class I SAM-dependent RNA methyltransferase [Bacteroidota bacterium]